MYGTDRRYRGKRGGGDHGFGRLRRDLAGAASEEAVSAAARAAEPDLAEAVTQPGRRRKRRLVKNVYRKNS